MVIVEKNTILPVLKELALATLKTDNFIGPTSFCFQGEHILTTNYKIAAQTETFLPAEEPFCVNAKRLIDVISKCATPKISLKQEENILVVSAGKFSTKLTLQKPDIRLHKTYFQDFYEMEPDLFKKIQACAAIASSVDNLSLASVHFAPDYMEATNRYQILSYEILQYTPDSKQVPGKSLQSLKSITPVSIGFESKAMHLFSTNNVHFSIGLSEYASIETIKDVHETVLRYTSGRFVALPEQAVLEILNAIARLKLVAAQVENQKTYAISITIQPNRFTLKSGSKFGEAQEVIKIDHTMAPIQINTVIEFLSFALENTPSPTLAIAENYYPQILIQNADGSQKHLISCLYTKDLSNTKA
jgi:hypothetical protein